MNSEDEYKYGHLNLKCKCLNPRGMVGGDLHEVCFSCGYKGFGDSSFCGTCGIRGLSGNLDNCRNCTALMNRGIPIPRTFFLDDSFLSNCIYCGSKCYKGLADSICKGCKIEPFIVKDIMAPKE